MQILAETEGDSQLKELLESDSRFRKGPRQLYKDFEKIREELDKELRNTGLTEFFESESSVSENKITVLRQYSLKKEFILEYFGLSEIDLIQLMKKRGFAEKFAVLRLNLIFDEILSEIKQDAEIMQGHSLVYYNPDITGFSIDFKYHIKIADLETDNGIKRIAKKIFDMDKNVDMKFKRKTGIDFYTKKAKRLEQQNNETIKQEEKKPEVKEEKPKKVENVTQQPEEAKKQDKKAQPQLQTKKEEPKNPSNSEKPKAQPQSKEEKSETKSVSDIGFDDIEDFDII